jgi:hypothetical protein
MELTETGFDAGRWMELAQDCVQWWALVLAVLKVLFVLVFKIPPIQNYVYTEESNLSYCVRFEFLTVASMKWLSSGLLCREVW